MSFLLAALAFAPRGTVLMIHGAGGGGWEYTFWKPVFERAGYAVVARDLVPAHASLAKTGFKDYVDQVVSWAPKSGTVILIGASMGGPLALKAAERIHPQAIVLVNGVPPKGAASMPHAPAFPAIVRWANGPLKDSEDSMPDSDRKTILWAWKKWRDESGKVMNELHSGVQCAKPKCPTLVVVSQNDSDVSPHLSAAVARWCGARVFGYAKMSHVGPLLGTSAQGVAKDVVEYLKSLPPLPSKGAIK